MRTILKICMLIGLFSLSLIFADSSGAMAQSKNSSLLSGTWTLEYDKSKDKMTPEAQTHYEKMNDRSRERFEKAYKGRKITFGADASYLQQLADGRKVSGTWRLTENDQIIEVVNQKGAISQYKIEKLTKKKLVLLPKTSSSANMMLAEWHFFKN